MANRRRKRKAGDRQERVSPSNQREEPTSPPSSSEASSGDSPAGDSRPEGQTRDAATPLSRESDEVGVPQNATGPAVLERLPSLARIMSVVMLMIGIVVVGALFYKVMAGFFVPLFLATLLVVIFRPVYDWILDRIGGRTRVAAVLTTLLILTVVLFPLILILSVAASQFSAVANRVSHVEDFRAALDRIRDRVSLSMESPEQFRRIDALADSLMEYDPEGQVSGQAGTAGEQILKDAREALYLIQSLDESGEGPAMAEASAAAAASLLGELTAAVESLDVAEQSGDPATVIAQHDAIHKTGVDAALAIRAWMREELGGAFWSQAKLIANPSNAELAALMRSGREFIQPKFVAITSATGAFVAQFALGMVILILSVYFFLVDGPKMIRTLMRLSPMDNNYERRLLVEFDRTSRAVVLASVLSALAQGVLAAFGFWLTGFESVILLFLLTSMMSLVPFLGAVSVWLPCALWLGLVEQRWAAAIFLAAYGSMLVSNIDNVIKMYVLHGRSALHPLFALLSVFGGLKVFGPIGVLIGPMVVVFLQTLLEILNHELLSTETDEQTARSRLAEASPLASANAK